jgi:hypothetical protein
MSLLDRLFGKEDPRPRVYEDATFGLPAGPAMQEHARRGEWRKVREQMAAETDAARRWRYASLAADGLDGAVAEWVEAEPDDVDAWLVAGMQAINRGAQIRGAAKADETPEENFDPFHECMQHAAAALQRAIELRPEDPLPRIPLLTVAMTLGAPIQERQALGEDALRYAPALVAAHVALMNALTKKWGGSHELMFESARRSVATAPPRCAVAAVLPLAHVERWLYIQHWENDEARWRAYFRQPDVLREVRDCHRRCASGPEGSVRWVANVFAFCFYLGDDARAARQEFEKAAGLYTGLPWDYMGGKKVYEHAMETIWRRGAPPAPAGR